MDHLEGLLDEHSQWRNILEIHGIAWTENVVPKMEFVFRWPGMFFFSIFLDSFFRCICAMQKMKYYQGKLPIVFFFNAQNILWFFWHELYVEMK